MVNRPNILWVSFEDTNPRYGCYGDPVARTPNLDRLAAEGCRWPNAFSTCGVCAPARSAVITGMYPISIGTHHMRTTHGHAASGRLPTPYGALLPHMVRCFTEYLRADGYYCLNNVKTDYQFDPPVTAWDELSPHAHWRHRPDPDQPFFAVFNPTRTHESGMWAPDDRKGQALELAFDPGDMVIPPTLPDTPVTREAFARMYTLLEQSDQELGRLLAELEKDGLAENTLVVHWSDHGPLPRGKRWPYDSGIHVPMIMRWPGQLDGGSVDPQLVSTVDLGPTMLSVAGRQVPAHMQGRAFLGEQAAPARDYVFASRDRHDEAYDMVRAVRDTRFKYIRNYCPELPYLRWIPYRNKHPIMQELWRLHLEDGLDETQSLLFQYPRPVHELYDTVADPHETRNLADDLEHVDELRRLQSALDAWLDEVGDLGRIPEAEMVRRWYPDGTPPDTLSPFAVALAPGALGREQSPRESTLTAPARVQLQSPTQGASIAFSLEGDGEVRWCLYTEPIALPVGETRLRAKAIRIGFNESPEVQYQFRVQAAS